MQGIVSTTVPDWALTTHWEETRKSYLKTVEIGPQPHSLRFRPVSPSSSLSLNLLLGSCTHYVACLTILDITEFEMELCLLKLAFFSFFLLFSFSMVTFCSSPKNLQYLSKSFEKQQTKQHKYSTKCSNFESNK